MQKTAILVGTSGLVGSQLLDLLLSENKYTKIYSLVRTKRNKDTLKLTELEVDFDQLDQTEFTWKVDDIYCCLGTTIKKAGSQENFIKVDLEYVIASAKLAQKNGATRMMVISSVGADPNSRVFYSKVKGEMEQALAALNIESLFIFRPSMLGGHREEFRLGEKIGSLLLKLFGWMMVGKAKRYRMISDKKVAKAMLSAATDNRTGVQIIESEELH